MKSFICLFILLISFQSLSSQHPYYIKEKKFKRIIRPQLKNIYQNFFQTIKYISPLYEQFYPIFQLTQQIQSEYLNLKKQDALTNADLKKIYLKISHLDKILLKQQEFQLNNKTMKKSINSHLKVLNKVNTLSHLILSLLNDLEKTVFLSTSQNVIHPNNLEENIFKLHFYSGQLLLHTLPKEYSEKYLLVWTNFFRIISNQILMKNNASILSMNLYQLNLIWNDFHMKVAKSKNKAPGKMIALLSQIHSRWNYILKFIHKR